jgi:hypothetical protein
MMALYIEIEQAQKGDSRLLEVHALSVATVAASYMLGGLASLVRITGIGQPEPGARLGVVVGARSSNSPR